MAVFRNNRTGVRFIPHAICFWKKVLHRYLAGTLHYVLIIGIKVPAAKMLPAAGTFMKLKKK